jgi:hypothetical protein
MLRVRLAAVRLFTYLATAGLVAGHYGCGGSSSGDSSMLQTVLLLSLIDRMKA